MTISRAGQSDVPAMLRLMAHLAEEHARRDEFFLPGEDWLRSLESNFRERLSRTDSLFLVAREGDELIGMASCTLQATVVFLHQPRAVIENFIVLPRCRRRGIGRQLFAEIAAWTEQQGAAYLELSVACANAAGRRFWAACGFEPVMLRLKRAVGGDLNAE